MDDQLFLQLDQRITEHHDHLCRRLDDLAEAIQSIHAALTARLEAHEAYHAANEHKWGALKLAQKYPFRLAALAFISAWALLSSVAEASPWIQEVLRKILNIVLG